MGQSSSGKPAADAAVRELSVLRHELLNVLHGMTGVTRLLQDSGLDAEQRAWLEALQQSVSQAGHLVRAAAPWESNGVSENTPAPGFNGTALLEQVVLAHTAAAEDKGLCLELSIEAAVPGRWRGDACLLRQLLDNVLGNAVKYTERGWIRLAAALDGDTTVVLSVSDTGPGIPEAERELVFQARRRGAGGRGHPGCGLGLWLSRRIARRLGGEIRCHAAPGGGAEFRVSLPGLACSRPYDQPW